MLDSNILKELDMYKNYFYRIELLISGSST